MVSRSAFIGNLTVERNTMDKTYDYVHHDDRSEIAMTYGCEEIFHGRLLYVD